MSNSSRTASLEERQLKPIYGEYRFLSLIPICLNRQLREQNFAGALSLCRRHLDPDSLGV